MATCDPDRTFAQKFTDVCFEGVTGPTKSSVTAPNSQLPIAVETKFGLRGPRSGPFDARHSSGGVPVVVMCMDAQLPRAQDAQERPTECHVTLFMAALAPHSKKPVFQAAALFTSW